jgi:hypothetical protein
MSNDEWNSPWRRMHQSLANGLAAPSAVRRAAAQLPAEAARTAAPASSWLLRARSHGAHRINRSTAAG